MAKHSLIIAAQWLTASAECFAATPELNNNRNGPRWVLVRFVCLKRRESSGLARHLKGEAFPHHSRQWPTSCGIASPNAGAARAVQYCHPDCGKACAPPPTSVDLISSFHGALFRSLAHWNRRGRSRRNDRRLPAARRGCDVHLIDSNPAVGRHCCWSPAPGAAIFTTAGLPSQRRPYACTRPGLRHRLFSPGLARPSARLPARPGSSHFDTDDGWTLPGIVSPARVTPFFAARLGDAGVTQHLNTLFPAV